jgi:hypothetical protein
MSARTEVTAVALAVGLCTHQHRSTPAYEVIINKDTC